MTTLSFIYSDTLTQSALVDRVDAVARKYGLTKTASSKLFGGWNPNEFESAALPEVFDAEGIRALKKDGYTPLEDSRLARVCKAFPITIYDYTRTDDAIHIRLECADDNCFVLLSVSIWAEENLLFPGGFIHVEATDKAAQESIVEELSEFLHPEKDKNQTCRLLQWRKPPNPRLDDNK